MKSYTEPFEIDLVYLWVDGNDAEWLARKAQFAGKSANLDIEAVTGARSANNDELKYSLRSTEKYAPWIRRIFIVTDGQRPEWLDMQNGKISIVDIRELIPPEALPCYNSVIIEHFLYRIPGLSEHFLYANDDMFFNAAVTPAFFFTPEGHPVVRLQRSFPGKWLNKCRKTFGIHTNLYRRTIARAASLVESKFGKYYSGTPHHNIDSYRKSDCRQVCEETFRQEIRATVTNHLRSESDIQRIIYLYYALAVKRGKRRYTGRRVSCRIRLQKPDYMFFINRYHPALFCLNDSHHATDADRERVRPFLGTLFPKKSTFEV
jgi:hypothetical protein